MKTLVVWLAAVVVLGVASPVLANQIQVGYAGSSYGPYQTGIGGEFTLNDVNPNNWLDLSGYAATTSGFGGISSFQSFCIEKNEYLYPYSTTYNAALGTAAVNGGVGGGNPDQLSQGTAYLYSLFAQGTLAYNYTGDRASSAAALQQAIWYLEDEITLATPTNNIYLALLAQPGVFGSLTTAKLSASVTGNTYGVQVLNLTTTSGGVAQDQLYFKKPAASPPVSVPDGGSTLALLGTALLGAALAARRLGLGARG